MKKTLLENAYNNKSLIGVRTDDQDWDESIIGFVIELEDSFFTLKEIDQYGVLIGNTVFEIDNVINVEIDDRYQKRLQFVYDNRSKLKQENRHTIWKEGLAVIPHLKTLFKENTLITFYFDEDDYVIGILLKYDKKYLLIKNIGTEGDEDGISCHPIDRLIGIRYKSLEEQKIKMLYENRDHFYEK